MHDEMQGATASRRFAVTFAGDIVTKRGDSAALAREARGLRMASGLDVAPRLLHAGRGVITSDRVDGAQRHLGDLDASDARTLGALIRRLHDGHRGATGGLPHWRSRARSVTAYRRRRAEDAVVAAGDDRDLAERVVAALSPMDATPSTHPFRFAHGDLVASNILWTPAPRLIDFEFWRLGDPAEDLAYLIEVNALPRPVIAGVLAGYGDDQVAARLDAWRALCALDAGLWYRAAGLPDRAAELIGRAVRARRKGTTSKDGD